MIGRPDQHRQLFARNPDWSIVFDMNAAQARETRRKVFEMVVNTSS
jgi:hypothetical protein